MAPRSREEFQIAIICALPLEADAVEAIFDEHYDENGYTYGKQVGDDNTYTTGSMSGHHVVLVVMPGMGNRSSASVARGLRVSFTRIKVSLVVGICGGVPYLNDGTEVILGDVVISDSVIEYDFGRQYPDGFQRKTRVKDTLGQPNQEIRSFLNNLRRIRKRIQLQQVTTCHLQEIQGHEERDWSYPGVSQDKLFAPSYRHRHYQQYPDGGCICRDCHSRQDKVCEQALKSDCQRLGCAGPLIQRRRLNTNNPEASIHIGTIASANAVMKSGEDREKLADEEDIIGLEMEGAGVWDNLPCIIIKGVCDYADSHKNEVWQNYAAATAASCAKGFLKFWGTGRAPDEPRPSSAVLPHRDEPFIGQDIIVESRLPDLTINVLNRERDQKEKEIEILRKLNTSPYQDRKDRNPDRISGTCEWFLTHDVFQNWMNNKSSPFLWVSADPGCGKSVLARYLVDSVLPTTQSRTTCYFFFKDDFEDQKSVVSALCCILHQLFRHRRALLSEDILETFDIHGENYTYSFSELWGMLLSAARQEEAGEIICLLDALDECEEKGRAQLMHALRKLCESTKNFNLKFLITSRPYSGIRIGLESHELASPVIHLSGENETEMEKISKEIDIFIKARVQIISTQLKLELHHQDLLLQELMRVPHRTYLWAHLTLDLLEGDIGMNKSRIVAVVSQLPKTVDNAYEKILSRSYNPKDAKKLLHIVVAAVRPLTVKEMALALALHENCKSYDDLDLMSEAQFREYVRDLCGLFVTIIDSRIYLLHQTAKEFLLQTSPGGYVQIADSTSDWKYSLNGQESHGILLQICMWYLLFDEFDKRQAAENETVAPYLDNHVFLEYSAKYWSDHFNLSDPEDRPTVDSLRELCTTNSPRFQIWFKIYWGGTDLEYPGDVTILMVASYFGLSTLVSSLLEDGGDVNRKYGTYGRSALSWAAEKGHDVIVKLLTGGDRRSWKRIVPLAREKGADIESVDVYGRTPLSYAAWHGHFSVVRMLLDLGAHSDKPDEIGGTPLFYAICNGHQDIVDLLLKTGVRVESKDKIFRDLLFAAARMGHDAVITLLLQTDQVDPNQTDEGGCTSLHWAAIKGHESIVQLLLETGKVDTDHEDNDGRTPLYYAVINGRKPVIRLLVDIGKVDLNQPDKDGRTPLHWAVMSRQAIIFDLLFEMGKINPNQTDGDGRTLLHLAVMNGHRFAVLSLLHMATVDPNLVDKRGWTPLHLAAMNGDQDIAWLLFNMGTVDPNIGDKDRRTPLHLAVMNGHEGIAWILLSRGTVHTNLADKDDRTPLQLAVQNSHMGIAQLLLKRGPYEDNE